MRNMKMLRVFSAIVLATLFVLPSALAFGTSDMEPKVKVLVWTDAPGSVKALKTAGVDVLEEYGSFALVKGTNEQLAHLDVMETQYNLNTVDLLQYVIDHRTGEPALPKGLAVDSYGDTGHYIVQFYGPIRQIWEDELTAQGAVVDQYIQSNAFIVKMDMALKDRVAKDPKVQYVGIYQPAYKVQMGLLKLQGQVTVQSLIFNDSALFATLNEISQFGEITFLSTVTSRKVGIILDASDIPRLARIDAVKWVEFKFTAVSYTATATWILQSGVSGSTPMYDHGIHGENQTTFNSDTGISVSHEAFRDASHSVQFSDPSTNTAPDPNHRKIVNYWTFADNSDTANVWYHGTHTNGVTAGDATPNGGTFKGIAWAAKISFGDVGNSWGSLQPPNDLNNLFIKGFNDGASVASNSWGMPWSAGAYDTEAQEIDQFMWDHKTFQINFAAGNDGSGGQTVSAPSTAKDDFAIGAGAHDNNGDMMGYSSRGPTADGRLKPEVYVPTDEMGPCGDTSCGDTHYASAGGTSNACPTSAGAMALIRQYYTDGFYPSGAKDALHAFIPSSALLRATAANGAQEKQGANAHDHPYNGMPFPNNDQGFGYMTLHKAQPFTGEANKLYIDDHTKGLSTGESVDYYVNIVDSTTPLKITLAWTDAPGPTGGGAEIVNNLDLTVGDPTSNTYKGNVFRTSGSPHESVPGGSADAKNVIEQFLLTAPPKGGFSVKVTAMNVPKDTQPFAIVINGNFVRDPDLAILKAELKVDPGSIPNEGDTLQFNGTVHNYGGLVTQLVPMQVLIDGNKVTDISFDFSTADRKNFSYVWKAVVGTHRFDFVVDPLNLIKEADKTNNVVNTSIWVNGLPHANLSLTPDKPYTMDYVTANASKSTDDGVIQLYKFDFGDGFKGQWQKLPAQSHPYKNDGIYNVTAWVKDNMSVISPPVMLSIVVLNRIPIVNATAATLKAYTYATISFDGTRSKDLDGTITWKWDFGDGTTSTEVKPVHNWTDNGEYNVTLRVTDDDKATNQTTLVVTILDQAPTASFTANVYHGNATTKFLFNATGKDRDGNIVYWMWNFGDGNTSSKQNPTHSYAHKGDYNVSFYAVDDDMSKSPVTNRTITIENLPPIANFTASTYEALTLENIKFMDLSQDLDGRIINLNWDMGDGRVFKDANVNYQYKENGIFTVKLTVQDNDDAISTKEVQIKIKDRPPVARALFNSTAHVGDLLVLTGNQSTDVDGSISTYTWTFNGTEKKYGQTITWAFWEVGTHNFTLTVMDNDGSMNTTTLQIDITKKPIPNKPTIIGGASPFTLLLIVILIACVVGAVIGAAYYSRKKERRASPSVGKVAQVPLSTTMDIDSASAGRTTTPEPGFQSAYQHQSYGKVEAYPFYGQEVVTASPNYDYGPGYDDTGAVAVTPTTKKVEEEPPTEVEEEEEIPIKPIIVEHEAVATRVAEPVKPEEPEPRPDDAAKKAKEKEIKESDDLDQILSMLDDTK